MSAKMIRFIFRTKFQYSNFEVFKINLGIIGILIWVYILATKLIN